jgi:thymidylate synthase (FAD)
MTLRSDPSAQWEIRQYSDAIGQIVAELFPRTWSKFEEGQTK